MSLGSGPMSPKRWRPWEQIGWGLGVAAGAVAPLCLWSFTITWRIANALRPARSKRHP
ncbi:hypothetical protein [Lichenibacterium dinghuense]|uniref:hypothetical protein n=1 Tax=Lichenibacterium dinghuense TaxID=2895977 RepID=UPI001F1CF34A|nr:hypothetical protein [Lichenibacterium sp. 6Y81]